MVKNSNDMKFTLNKSSLITRNLTNKYYVCIILECKNYKYPNHLPLGAVEQIPALFNAYLLFK